MTFSLRLPLVALAALVLLGLGGPRPALAFSTEVALGASGVEFNGASPTLNIGRPDLVPGVSLSSDGGPGTRNAADSFREIYVGQDPGTGQSVEWEVDGSGSATLGGATLRAEALARDNRNAQANDWTFEVFAGYEETIELEGPATNGFYEATFTVTLDPFDADPNPVAPSFVWETRADVTLNILPASGDAFGDFSAALVGILDDGCPDFGAPAPDCDPFFGYTRPPFEDSATIFVPASNPFVTIRHNLRLGVTSAHADVSNSSRLELELEPGVAFESESGVFLTSAPEPAAAWLALAAVGWIGALRRS